MQNLTISAGKIWEGSSTTVRLNILAYNCKYIFIEKVLSQLLTPYRLDFWLAVHVSWSHQSRVRCEVQPKWWVACLLQRRQADQDLGSLRRQVREDRLRTQVGHLRRGVELRLKATRVSFRRQNTQDLGAVVSKMSKNSQGQSVITHKRPRRASHLPIKVEKLNFRLRSFTKNQRLQNR